MLRSAVLLCVLAALVKGQTEVSQCTINSGELPLYAEIEGCVTPPCALPQLQDAVINLVFRVPYYIRRMQTKASVWLFITSFDHNLAENAETCNFLQNSYCPVLEGEIIKYTLKMFILQQWYAGTMVTIEFRIEDDDGKSFVCLRVPIRVAHPVNNLISGSALNATITHV